MTNHDVAVKRGTVPGIAGCTVVSSKKQRLVLALPENCQTCQTVLWGRSYDLQNLVLFLFTAHSASPNGLRCSVLT